MAKIAAPADRATEPARPEELQPAPGVDLGRAGRAGIVGGVAAIFVCAVGMVAAFEGRGVVAGVTLAYVLLAAVPLVSGYVAGRPPPQLEGFEPPRPGPRNAAAGVLAGAVAGALLAAFMVVIDNFDIRAMFTNVSPELLDVLALGLGTGVAGASHVAVGGLLGGVGGATHLLPERARKAAIMALTWVVVFGLLEDVVKTLMDGIDVDPLIGVMYASEGGLTLVGGALVAGAVFALYWWLGRERTPLRERLESLPEGQRRRVTGAALAVLLLVLVVLPRILGVFLSEVLDVAGIFLLMALGLNIVVGYAGLLDLGYVAFFAVGAYTTAVLTSPIAACFSEDGWLASVTSAPALATFFLA